MNAIDHYVQLTSSPMILHGLFGTFYRYQVERPKNILLAYLVLPIITHGDSMGFLKNARSSSSLRSFCKKKEHIIGLEKRMRDYRSDTTRCIQLMIDLRVAVIKTDLSVRMRDDAYASPLLPDLVRCAKNLSTILTPYSIPETFTYLGIRAL